MSNDIAYANRDFIPDADTYPPRWAELAARFRADLAAQGRMRMAVAYDDGARNTYDLFLPDGAVRGTVMFVHGGYWRLFDNSYWSHLAAGPLAHGWAVAMPSYPLCPAMRIADVTISVAGALDHLARAQTGPIRLAGHSAGGHLVARMLCGDVDIGAAEGRIVGCCPISPVTDLRPLIDTAMNADFLMDDAAARAESPALTAQSRPAPVTVWVGAEERPAFLDQARWLTDAWPAARLHVEPGRHHFDVIEPLADPDSALTRAVIG